MLLGGVEAHVRSEGRAPEEGSVAGVELKAVVVQEAAGGAGLEFAGFC